MESYTNSIEKLEEKSMLRKKWVKYIKLVGDYIGVRLHSIFHLLSHADQIREEVWQS